MKLVEVTAGIGMVVGGVLLLLAWKRERKYPDQKKVGVALIAIGCIVALTGLL